MKRSSHLIKQLALINFHLLITGLILSCNKHQTKWENISPVVEEITVIRKAFNPSYQYKAFDYYTSKDSTYFSFFNEVDSQLYCINLSAEFPSLAEAPFSVDHFKIDSFGLINSIHCVGDKYLAIEQAKQLAIFHQNDTELLYSRKINYNDSLQVYFGDCKFPIHYDTSENNLYARVIHYYNEEDRAYPFETEFHSRLTLGDDSLIFLALKYPPSFGNGELGMSAYVNACFLKERIVYNFSNDSCVYVLDKSTQEVKKYLAKSKFHQEQFKLSIDSINDYKKDLKYSEQNFKYLSIHFDSERKQFYRIYKKRNSSKKGLILLDSNLNKLYEWEIPHQYASSFGIGKKGLLYKYFIENTDSIYIRFAQVRFEMN